MKETITGFAAWHPTKGFDEFSYEGPIVFADLSARLIEDVKDLNEEDGTNARTGWRATKVLVTKIVV